MPSAIVMSMSSGLVRNTHSCRSGPISRVSQALQHEDARRSARHRPLRHRAAEFLRRRQFRDPRRARRTLRQRPRRRRHRSDGDIAGDARHVPQPRRAGCASISTARSRRRAATRWKPSFAATAAAARMNQWHVQVIAPLPGLLRNADVLAKSPVPVVIDHYGLYGDKRPDSAEGRRLLDLVRLPHIWMKLSAPYRHDRGPLNMVARPRMDRGAARGRAGSLRLGQRLAASAASRRAEGRQPRSAVSRTVLHGRWSTSSSPRCRRPIAPTRVMRDNAARLYGF